MRAPASKVLEYLALAGLLDRLTDIRLGKHSVHGKVTTMLVVVDLRKDARFYEGNGHYFHAKDVGNPRTEFRSFKGVDGLGPLSLQFVVNTFDGTVYADLDKYNYQDLVNLIGHNVGEVVAPWFRRKPETGETA